MIATLALTLASACPSPSPSPQRVDREAQVPPGPVVAPAPDGPRVAVIPDPPAAVPPTTPPELEGPALPAALAAEGVSWLARTTWRAIEATNAGDEEAMGRTMLPTAPWLPPGGPEEFVSPTNGMPRAMAPWTSPRVQVQTRRMIDLGPQRIAAQLTVHDASKPELRYEIAIVVDGRGDRISAIRQYGDPLGPLRSRAEDSGRTLDLGPVGELVVEGGAPTIPNVAATKTLVEALDEHDDAALTAVLADDVVLHDVKMRRTRRGRDAYLEGYRATLGDTGHMQILHQHASQSFVVMEGAVSGIETSDDGTPREHGFADIHRLDGGRIVETWHYLNRRGRPHVASKQAGLVQP